MNEITLADVEAEIARGAAPDAEPEAVVILLIPRGSPFASYAEAMVAGVAASQGRARAFKIDTTAEPGAPARFGLSGAPGLVLFVGGKQVAAFAVPMVDTIGQAIAPLMKRIMGMRRGQLPPGGGTDDR